VTGPLVGRCDIVQPIHQAAAPIVAELLVHGVAPANSIIIVFHRTLAKESNKNDKIILKTGNR